MGKGVTTRMTGFNELADCMMTRGASCFRGQTLQRDHSLVEENFLLGSWKRSGGDVCRPGTRENEAVVQVGEHSPEIASCCPYYRRDYAG